MTFWLEIALAYLLLLAVGLTVGRLLSARRDGGPGGTPYGDPGAGPGGPGLAAAWLPLGSDFDRAFLPAAFADEPAPTG